MKLHVPSEEHILPAGELAIINANIPHEASGVPVCELNSLVFSPLLISGNRTSSIYKKYLLPLMECPTFTCFAGLKEADAFCTAFDALKKEQMGYEMIVQNSLSHILLALYEAINPDKESSKHTATTDLVRLEQMLSFIFENYQTNISLTDIAAAGGVGERECLRCFKRTISDSPMQYLLKYRLMQGANMLTETPDKSISEISELCGFEYTSYFSKQFRRFYLCSPREYRKTTQDVG